MLQLSGCLEMLYRQESPDDFVKRIELIAETPIPAIEFWSWQNKDLAAVKAAADRHNLPIVGMTVVSKTNIVDPSSHATFVEDVKASCEAANRMNCKSLIVTNAEELDTVPRARQHDALVEAMRAAAPVAEAAGVTLLLEPLNILVNHKGKYLYLSSEGFEIVKKVGSPHVKLLFDVYHQQISEGNLISNFMDNLDLIGHFHVADNPGRNQPGTGEINYNTIFKCIADSDYSGYVGLEYMPKNTSTEATLRAVAMIAQAATMTQPVDQP